MLNIYTFKYIKYIFKYKLKIERRVFRPLPNAIQTQIHKSIAQFKTKNLKR